MTILYNDTFTAANGTLLEAHTADSGQGYIASAVNKFDIQGNELYPSRTSQLGQIRLDDSAANLPGDGILRWRYIHQTGQGLGPAIGFRAERDNDSACYAVIADDNGSGYDCFQYSGIGNDVWVAQVFSNAGTLPANGASAFFQVNLAGDSVRVRAWSDTWEGSASTLDETFSAAAFGNILTGTVVYAPNNAGALGFGYDDVTFDDGLSAGPTIGTITPSTPTDTTLPSGSTAVINAANGGNWWAGVYADAATPSHADIKAGTGAAGTPAFRTGGVTTDPETVNIDAFTGLAAATTYKLWVTAEDSGAGAATPASAQFTTATTATELRVPVQDEDGIALADGAIEYAIWAAPATLGVLTGDPDLQGNAGTVTAGEFVLTTTGTFDTGQSCLILYWRKGTPDIVGIGFTVVAGTFF